MADVNNNLILFWGSILINLCIWGCKIDLSTGRSAPQYQHTYFFPQALRGKRAAEQAYEDAQARINELQTININLSASRAKLEQELNQFSSDYEEVTKELRVSWSDNFSEEAFIV